MRESVSVKVISLDGVVAINTSCAITPEANVKPVHQILDNNILNDVTCLKVNETHYIPG